MDAKRILNYLKQLMANNNRDWYLANKAEYDTIRADFEEGVKLAIGRIASFDPSIAHLSVKDCTYRFNRDTRFSNDKSPYKNHLGDCSATLCLQSPRDPFFVVLCCIAIGSMLLRCCSRFPPRFLPLSFGRVSVEGGLTFGGGSTLLLHGVYMIR